MEHVLTAIAAPGSSALDESLVGALQEALVAAGAQPGPPRWLATGEAVDLPFTGAEPGSVATAARTRLPEAPLDLCVQPSDGRRKRLLVADMESTIIAEELVDALAAQAGIGAEVAAITDRSMRGEIDFAASLRERVALLKGVSAAAIDHLRESITLNPGARSLVRTMRAHGAFTALVSGGFTCFTEPVRAACGFDEARGNRLMIADGALTGDVGDPILDRDTKREALEELAQRLGISTDAACAVGDGANDLAMVTRAGLGVAYHAKPVLRAAATAVIDHGDLTALLYLQGYAREDFAA